jgi:hypothetical protein
MAVEAGMTIRVYFRAVGPESREQRSKLINAKQKKKHKKEKETHTMQAVNILRDPFVVSFQFALVYLSLCSEQGDE